MISEEEQHEEERKRLWRIRQTTAKMLYDRKYKIAEDSLNKTYDEFVQGWCSDEAKAERPGSLRDRLTFLTSHKLTGEPLWVFFEGADKVKKKHIEDIRDKMLATEPPANRAILIYAGDLTSLGEKTIDVIAAEGRRIEYFKENELIINITEHKWVPKHELLTDDEKEELLRRYKAKPTQLPRIQDIDPVARYMGLTVGQIIKITRTSETAGRYVTYRRVIRGPRR